MSITVGVIGAGTMGAGIAQVAAQAGCDVLLYDVADEMITRGQLAIAQDLQRGVDRGKVGKNEADEILMRIHSAPTLEHLRSASVVIEAAVERLNIKQDIFSALDRICSAETLLATNTSSLSVTEIAAVTRFPERVVGMHFFNPVPKMRLVEVVSGHRTTPEYLSHAKIFAERLGKDVVVAKDSPGFIVNRVARNFYGEALRLLGEGAGTVEVIDRSLRALGLAMGPFELMDMIGIDVNLAVTESVYNQFYQEPRFRPHPIQRKMVQAQLLGRKTKQGFYRYDA